MSEGTVRGLTGIPNETRNFLSKIIAGVGAAPVDGVTLKGNAPKGSLYVDSQNAVLYRNIGDLASPKWAPTGPSLGATSNVYGVGLVLHIVTTGTGANGDVNVLLTQKTRVIRVDVVNTAAGTTGSTLTVKNGTTAITDAIVTSAGDKTIASAATIDDAQHEIAAGGTLRCSRASSGGDYGGGQVYVYGYLVA